MEASLGYTVRLCFERKEKGERREDTDLWEQRKSKVRSGHFQPEE